MMKISRDSKCVGKVIAFLLCVLLISVSISGLVSAWSPERETFTMENPADFIIFNSITYNPTIGDERNFVRIREAGVGTFGNEVELILGREYEVYIFFHNNASATLNPTGAGIAQNVRVRSSFPDTILAGERLRVEGEISASNSTPESVLDHAYITNSSDTTFTLRFIPASAVIHSSGEVNGRVLPYNLFSEVGTFIGHNKLDGIIPGCAEFSGHIIAL